MEVWALSLKVHLSFRGVMTLRVFPHHSTGSTQSSGSATGPLRATNTLRVLAPPSDFRQAEPSSLPLMPRPRCRQAPLPPGGCASQASLCGPEQPLLAGRAVRVGAVRGGAAGAVVRRYAAKGHRSANRNIICLNIYSPVNHCWMHLGDKFHTCRTVLWRHQQPILSHCRSINI